MNKKCRQCKIEFTPNLIKKYFCDAICKKGYRRGYLKEFYNKPIDKTMVRVMK